VHLGMACFPPTIGRGAAGVVPQVVPRNCVFFFFVRFPCLWIFSGAPLRVQDNVARQCCKAMLQDNVARQSCKTMLQDNVARECCETILQDNVVGRQCCKTILQDNVARQ
jgi:hypothetical protein